MSTPTARAFPPARIVALVIIALLTTGLIYLRLAPGDKRSPCRMAPKPGT